MFSSLNSTASNITPSECDSGSSDISSYHSWRNTEAYSGGGGVKLLASTSTGKKLDSILIKVMNVTRKQDSKMYMLNLNMESLHKLKDLREDTLDQLGKEIVPHDLKFSVGYYLGSHHICFAESDDIKI